MSWGNSQDAAFVFPPRESCRVGPPLTALVLCELINPDSVEVVRLKGIDPIKACGPDLKKLSAYTLSLSRKPWKGASHRTISTK